MYKLIPSLLILLIPYQIAAVELTQVPMEEKGTATYYITAEIAGYTVDLLVDTGAGYSTLNKSLLKKLKRNGQAHKIGEIEAVLANGSFCKLPVYRISRMNLGGKCILKNIEVAETPSHSHNLLGLTALRKAAPFTFSLSPDELKLSHCLTTTVEARQEKP